MRSMAGVARIELANAGVMVVEIGFEPISPGVTPDVFPYDDSTKSRALTAWLHAIIFNDKRESNLSPISP